MSETAHEQQGMSAPLVESRDGVLDFMDEGDYCDASVGKLPQDLRAIVLSHGQYQVSRFVYL